MFSAGSSLRAAYQAVIKDTVRTPPVALEKLAKITDFRLYVTTALDRMMEEALAKANRPCASISLKMSYRNRKDDLHPWR